MISVLAPILGASLLGSPHCAAMCGGFVCFYSGAGRVHPLSHLAYNGGRLLSYALLGALAGALGAGLDHLGTRAGLTRAPTILAGALMVVWGAGSLLTALGARLPERGVAGAGHRVVARVLRRLADRPPAVRALALGLVTTLLPCGFLHVFVAAAAGTGSPARGALVMAVFWIGTVPMMAGLGVIAQRAFGPLRARLPLVTAATLLVVGALTLAGKLQLAAAHGMHHVGH